MNNLDDMSAEFNRLSDIESRLIATWHKTDKELDAESSLLRCADLRSIMRRCEIYLGYVPTPKTDEITPTE